MMTARHVLPVFAVYAVRFIGLVLMYAAVFLREDEERRFQNRIEEWWIRLSYTQAASLSRAAIFMREVARLMGKGLDELFGRRLFSSRFVVVSIYLSFASFFFFVFLAIPLTHNNPPNVTRIAVLRLLLFFVAMASIPACFSQNRFILTLWWAIIPITLISMSGFLIFVFRRYGLASAVRGIGVALVPFAVSVCCDFLYIVLTRWILRRVSTVDRFSTIVLLLAGNVALVAVLLVGTIYIGLAVFKLMPQVGAFIALSFVFNLLDVLAGCAFVVLAMLLLLHRLFWPIVQRPLYAIQRFTPIRNKKWLFGVGLTLLLFPAHLTTEAFKRMLEKL